MWIVCITSVRHVLTVNGYGGRQTKENEKSWCFKGWETLVNLNSIEALPGMKGVKIKLNSAVNGEVTVPFELMDEPTPNEVKQMDFSKMEIE